MSERLTIEAPRYSDPEIQSIAICWSTLERLTPSAQSRVLAYLASLVADKTNLSGQ